MILMMNLHVVHYNIQCISFSIFLSGIDQLIHLSNNTHKATLTKLMIVYVYGYMDRRINPIISVKTFYAMHLFHWTVDHVWLQCWLQNKQIEN